MAQLQAVTNPLRHFEKLQSVLEMVLGTAFDGFNLAPNGNVAIFSDAATVEQIGQAMTIIEAHNQITVLANKTTITADGVDTAIITCNHAQIAADGAVDYTVWLDDDIYSEDSDSVVAGEVTLNLATNAAGLYRIEIRRQSGNYASGYVEVTAE